MFVVVEGDRPEEGVAIAAALTAKLCRNGLLSSFVDVGSSRILRSSPYRDERSERCWTYAEFYETDEGVSEKISVGATVVCWGYFSLDHNFRRRRRRPDSCFYLSSPRLLPSDEVNPVTGLSYRRERFDRFSRPLFGDRDFVVEHISADVEFDVLVGRLASSIFSTKIFRDLASASEEFVDVVGEEEEDSFDESAVV